jgi:hypothetical protein
MRVIATRMGFYGGTRIREGVAFEVPDGTKGKWFEPAEQAGGDAVKKPASKKPKADGGPSTFSELAHRDAALVAGGE